MKIRSICTLTGPNVFHLKPVLKALVDLEKLTEIESYQVPGFITRLLAAIPGLEQHTCSKGYPGGFVERLKTGTYFGHIAEHIAIELCCMAGCAVKYGKTVYADRPGHYYVVMRFVAEEATRFLLQAAVDFVNAIVAGETFDLNSRLERARELIRDCELGPSTKAIVDAAESKGVPWLRLNEGSLVQLGYGVNRRLVQATQSQFTSSVSVDIASDKQLTKQLLRNAAISVPQGVTLRREDALQSATSGLEPPLVVKPRFGNHGKGVRLNVTDRAQILDAVNEAFKFDSEVVIEECFKGADYRIFVVDGRLVAASRRIPAHVIGDGIHSILELIAIENYNPQRGQNHDLPLTLIDTGPDVRRHLANQSRSLSDVPISGETIFLRETANLSTGGTAIDVTDEVHPQIASMCIRAARIVGLDICGIDLITPDIAEPLPKNRAGIIEINAAPGIRMHHYPTKGQNRDAGRAIVDMLYPPGKPSRIPIIAVTGTNGKTTTTRMIAHTISRSTEAVLGMTSTDGIFIGGDSVLEGDTTGSASARIVLSDPTVEVAVLEVARGGLVRRGLGYDLSDVAVFTNIQPDHLGQDGIENLEDLVHIKSLVAETVKEGGTLIINADDPQLLHMLNIERVRRVKREIVYFSLSPENAAVAAHLKAGGTAYYLNKGQLVEARGDSEIAIMRENSLQCALGGLAKFQLANSLAAIAACRAYGLGIDQIVVAMSRFNNCSHNPGRLNIYQVKNGYAIVDYGHNPGAFDAICHLAAEWRGRRVTGVFTVPGDRWDGLLRQSGKIMARGFDRLIIREDYDLRGRRRGEVSRQLCSAVEEESPHSECHIILDEIEAVETALSNMVDGEVVVCFYEDRLKVMDVLNRFRAQPVSGIEPANMLEGTGFGQLDKLIEAVGLAVPPVQAVSG